MTEIKFRNDRNYIKNIIGTPITIDASSNDSGSSVCTYKKCIGIIDGVDEEYVYGFLYNDFTAWYTAMSKEPTYFEIVFE